MRLMDECFSRALQAAKHHDWEATEYWQNKHREIFEEFKK